MTHALEPLPRKIGRNGDRKYAREMGQDRPE